MRVLSTNVFQGPNRFALFPVILQEVDLGALEDYPTVRLGRFVEQLVAAVPELNDHGCSHGEPGGFIRRMTEDEGTWMGHVYEHLVLAIQNAAGMDVGFGKTRETKQAGHYHVVFEYEDRDVGLAAAQLGLKLIHSLLPAELRPADAERDFDYARERDQFLRYTQKKALGPSTASLVKAAVERKIPWIRLNSQSLVQLGYGKFQKRLQATITSETRHIAVELSCDKELTHQICEDVGLPVPKQRVASGPRDAVRAAEKVGYPVVVKPFNGNHGRGVVINLKTAEEVEAAYAQASQVNRTVVIESYIEGFDHRMLVINGEIVAVAKRVPGHVIGDGRQTVRDLVDEINRDPRRGVGHEKVLTRLEFDAQAERMLERQGLSADSVPARGETVWLRATANMSTGGTAVDVTDIVHPDNRAMAIRAARALGLDVCGVDFLTTDIAQSYRTVGGAICEINAAPGFRMHIAPTEGKPRDVSGPVIEMLFPPGTPNRIPIAAITGTNGKTTTSRMLAHILKLAGHTVGLTSTDGVYIDGNLVCAGDMTGPVAATMVLRDPTVDAAVLETARGGLAKRGMALREVDVAACLNVQADHLGQNGIDTLEDLADVKRVVIEVAQDTAVLNADDPLCLRMAGYSEARHICYVTMNPTHPLVREHIRAGGRAFVLEQGMNGHMIAMYDRGTHTPLLWTHLIPATLEGRALHNVQNAMFAAALAHAMKVSRENIEHGLRTFNTSFFQSPGRLNLFDEHPFRVLMDYAHNAPGLRLLVRTVDQFKVPGRKILVLGAPGDRRDEDIAELARAAAGHFDHYVLKEDDERRGRRSGVVAALLEQALRAAGIESAQISKVLDEQEAVHEGLARAQTGDFLVITADKIQRTWKQIIYFKPDLPQAASTPEPKSYQNAPTPLTDLAELNDLASLDLIIDDRGVVLRPESSD